MCNEIIQLNFLVEHMGNSQLAYTLTRCLNNLADTRSDIDAIVFFNTIARHTMVAKFAMMQMIEAWGQPGYTIATSCATVRKMLQFPGPQKKFFYVWDLEWIRGDNKTYGMFADVFRHPELILIARSNIHRDAINNCFNRRNIYVIDDFNERELLEVIESEKINSKNSAA